MLGLGVARRGVSTGGPRVDHFAVAADFRPHLSDTVGIGHVLGASLVPLLNMVDVELRVDWRSHGAVIVRCEEGMESRGQCIRLASWRGPRPESIFGGVQTP